MNDPTRWIGPLFKRHPVLTYVLGGSLAFGLSRWVDARDSALVLRLLGCAAFAIAAFNAQDWCLSRTCGRDVRLGPEEQFDSAAIVKRADRTGWVYARDLRETASGGEVVLGLLGAFTLGVIASLFALGFLLFTRYGAADAVARMFDSQLDAFWSRAVLWVVGIVVLLVWVDAMLLEPISSLRYWFASRRLIERERMDALKILAAAANRDR